MRYRLRITRILLLFYLLGSFLSATHIHKEVTEVHNDCKVCHLSNTMHGGNALEEPSPLVVLPRYLVPLVCEGSQHPTPLIKGYNATAPPSFS